ncbi:uncharacterized protein [Rhodnius prolixus]|uniref:uncharacterized protein n=1 Tax=Rhodnius prolixus TaxID=13249 RepID=UPI003D189E3E
MNKQSRLSQQNGLHKRSYVCVNCYKRYNHSFTLYRHMRYECGKEPQFQCPYCQYKAKRSPHICTRCFKTFTLLHNLYRHRRNCTQEPHLRCSFCPYRSSRTDNLKMHMIFKHKYLPKPRT